MFVTLLTAQILLDVIWESMAEDMEEDVKRVVRELAA